MPRVLVTDFDLSFTEDGGDVITAVGTDEETGDRLVFAGKRRPMIKLIGEVEIFGAARVDVLPYQVLRRIAPA